MEKTKPNINIRYSLFVIRYSLFVHCLLVTAMGGGNETQHFYQ
ncbi:hypothetical protein [Dactylococcopsis salina]|nr:hypothetical protein [Dactylococcopsis salina]